MFELILLELSIYLLYNYKLFSLIQLLLHLLFLDSINEFTKKYIITEIIEIKSVPIQTNHVHVISSHSL